MDREAHRVAKAHLGAQLQAARSWHKAAASRPGVIGIAPPERTFGGPPGGLVLGQAFVSSCASDDDSSR